MKHHKSSSVPSIVYRPSLSSLGLQISLYYNSLYSLIFVVLIAACAVNKVNLTYDLSIELLMMYVVCVCCLLL